MRNAAVAGLLSAASILGLAGGAAAAPTPAPIAAFAHDPMIQSPVLSPDGKHLAALTSGPGRPITISIWDTAALDKPPVVFGLDDTAARANVRFLGVDWVSADRLIVIANQPLTTGSGDENRSFTYLARIVDREGKQWIEPLRRGGTKSDLEAFVDKFMSVGLFDDLPNDPDHIMLEYADFRRGTTDLYKVDVRDGRGERVARAGDDESFVPVVDAQGRPRVKQFIKFEGKDWIVGYRIFSPERNAWEDQPELSYPIRERRSVGVIAFDPENPNLLLIADNKGADLTAVKGYDLTKKAFVETLFAHPKFEASGVRFDRRGETNAPATISGFTYSGATTQTYWLDERMQRLEKTLQAQFPGQQIAFLGESPDDSMQLVEVSSSNHPPSYYLFKGERELIKVGDSRPEIDPANLAQTQLVYYSARDGLQIPGLLTLPKGYDKAQGRLPTVILPHGGPWARDTADWDPSGWTQFLASRGYAVLQPQYRGSEGWGDKLWKAGDREWGQKMQDDKDDGAQWLVDQGVADPKRMAMFGYSYGGFAAMAAAVRPNSPYKCAIAGAGVSDLDWAKRTWGESRIQRQLQGDTVGGMNPLANLDKFNLPMLVYHGDRDQTVPIVQSRQWVKALQGRGKPVKYFEVKEMPHSLPWWPSWQEQTLAAIEDYLKTDCGGGGL